MRGICGACASRNARNVVMSFFPISRNTQPVALCIKLWGWLRYFSAREMAVAKSLLRTNAKVLTMAMRCSHILELLLNSNNMSCGRDFK